MAKRLHGMPQCPCCGQRSSRVVLTKDALNGVYDIVRRRHCKICGHRWYTGQTNEQALAGVQWGNDVIYDTLPVTTK